jgi:hypothetical protein
MNTANSNRRRSDRLLMTIPLRAEWLDAEGRAVEHAARAISLNRYGARIRMPKALDCGQAVRLMSPIGHFRADFKVVDHIVPSDGEDHEYGVECLNDKENFWAIEFPDSDRVDGEDAHVLLECRICHSIALLPLTLKEVETLRTMGILARPCRTCLVETPWRFAAVRVPPNRMEDGANWLTANVEFIERGHLRVLMQLPLGIRDWQGSVDVTRTENTSDSGICFTSERKYLPGEIVSVLFPFDAATQTPETPARIVREEAIEGSNRRIFGATFEEQTWIERAPAGLNVSHAHSG